MALPRNRPVFADTLYWAGSIMPQDPWHEPAVQAIAALGADAQLLTTEEVLVEVLSAMAGRGDYWRGEAARLVRAALTNMHVTVLPQSHSSFLRALEFYESRLDKSYSPVDCISMCAMREHGITDILTNDHHFTQEGFIIRITR